ncbi:MAG: hypothetical protein KJN63_02175 [Acidimicrobiia bacterium]|nr:hypothetical protein [Acidimicrobiia bacterium]
MSSQARYRLRSLLGIAVALSLLLTVPATGSEPGVVAVTAADELPGIDDSISGVVGPDRWVVDVDHRAGSESFYWDGSALRVIFTDPAGNQTTTQVASPEHFVIDALKGLETADKTAGSVTVIPGKRSLDLSTTVSDSTELDARAKAFLESYSRIDASSRGFTVSAIESTDGEASINPALDGGFQTLAGTSGYTDGWVRDIWANLCVYQYSYRDLNNNNYWYSSSTAHGSCYYVGVSAYGDTTQLFDGGCDLATAVWRGAGPNANPRSIRTTTWPIAGWTTSDPACSNHTGWTSGWSQIALYTGLDAWMP